MEWMVPLLMIAGGVAVAGLSLLAGLNHPTGGTDGVGMTGFVVGAAVAALGVCIAAIMAVIWVLSPSPAAAAVTISVTSAMADSGGMVAKFLGWLAPIAMIAGGGVFAVLILFAEGMRSVPRPMPGENRALLWCGLLVMLAGIGLTGVNIWEAVR